MSIEQPSELPNSGDPKPTARVSFERLRERTDELELLISGLALFALISLPQWLLNQYLLYMQKMPLELMGITAVVVPLAATVCYLMAALLLTHLALRAYWVGLIGRKSAYPSGIDWSKLRGVGELVKSRAAERLDNLDNAIDRADRRASGLFSLVIFTATGALVLGIWLLAVFIVAILFGPAVGGSNAFVEMASPILAIVIVSTPILLWLLDGFSPKPYQGCVTLRGFAPL